ncbi:MAG: hypothetical protein WCK28_00665 [Burkholderiales bacterium]
MRRSTAPSGAVVVSGPGVRRIDRSRPAPIRPKPDGRVQHPAASPSRATTTRSPAGSTLTLSSADCHAVVTPLRCPALIHPDRSDPLPVAAFAADGFDPGLSPAAGGEAACALDGRTVDPATEVVAGRRRTPAPGPLDDRAKRGRGRSTASALRLPDPPTITRFCLVEGSRPAAYVMVAEREQDMLVLPDGQRAGGASLVSGRWTVESAYMLRAGGEPITEARFRDLVATAMRSRGRGFLQDGAARPPDPAR